MQPLVSVIVPVYNVENYLNYCLDSLYRQSLYEIEILLIDDASTDKSGEICDAYAVKDSRFRVFHNKVNNGLSVARNIGIANAHSEYLMFVDSDDWVHEDFCKATYKCAVHYDADLVMFRFERVKEKVSLDINSDTVVFVPSGYKTNIEAVDLMHKLVGNAAWNKLYRKDLFYNITYPVGLLCEDIGTTYKIIWKATRIYYLNKVLYYYYYHAGSITAQNTEKLWRDWCTMSIQQYHDLAACGYPLDKLDILLKNTAIEYCMKKNADTSDENYIFCANILLACKGFPHFFPWKRKIMLFLFKKYRPLFELICVLFDKKVG